MCPSALPARQQQQQQQRGATLPGSPPFFLPALPPQPAVYFRSVQAQQTALGPLLRSVFAPILINTPLMCYLFVIYSYCTCVHMAVCAQRYPVDEVKISSQAYPVNVIREAFGCTSR